MKMYTLIGVSLLLSAQQVAMAESTKLPYRCWIDQYTSETSAETSKIARFFVRRAIIDESQSQPDHTVDTDDTKEAVSPVSVMENVKSAPGVVVTQDEKGVVNVITDVLVWKIKRSGGILSVEVVKASDKSTMSISQIPDDGVSPLGVKIPEARQILTCNNARAKVKMLVDPTAYGESAYKRKSPFWVIDPLHDELLNQELPLQKGDFNFDLPTDKMPARH